MYTLIYNYILNYLFNDSDLSAYQFELLGVNTNMSEWLAHTLTIVSIVLIFVFLVIFIKWVFKVVSGLLLIK